MRWFKRKAELRVKPRELLTRERFIEGLHSGALKVQERRIWNPFAKKMQSFCLIYGDGIHARINQKDPEWKDWMVSRAPEILAQRNAERAMRGLAPLSPLNQGNAEESGGANGI